MNPIPGESSQTAICISQIARSTPYADFHLELTTIPMRLDILASTRAMLKHRCQSCAGLAPNIIAANQRLADRQDVDCFIKRNDQFTWRIYEDVGFVLQIPNHELPRSTEKHQDPARKACYCRQHGYDCKSEAVFRRYTHTVDACYSCLYYFRWIICTNRLSVP